MLEYLNRYDKNYYQLNILNQSKKNIYLTNKRQNHNISCEIMQIIIEFFV